MVLWAGLGLVMAGWGCSGFSGDDGGGGSGAAAGPGAGTGTATSMAGPSTSTGSTSTGSTSTGSPCSTDCSIAENATGECVGGQCVYTCATGFGDCDSDPSTCEVDFTADGNCGACGTTCGTGDCEMIGMDYACNDPISIVSGDSHVCALRADGTVWCWGLNNFGQLGIGGGVSSQKSPAKVMFSKAVTQISARGNTTCARLEDSTGACWGRNGNNSSTPNFVNGLSSVQAIAAAGNFNPGSGPVDGLSLSLKSPTGRVEQFQADAFTQPVVSGVLGSGATSIAAGGAHGCALDGAHNVTCYGKNEDKQTGNPTATPFQLTPAVVTGVVATQVVAGEAFTCVVTDEEGVKCWGFNNHGQAGVDDPVTPFTAPHDVDVGLFQISKVFAGHEHGGAITTTGELLLWGINETGIRQTATVAGDVKTPTEYVLTDKVKDVALGWHHSCVLIDGGKILCWGANSSGQLGNGSLDVNPNPTPGLVVWPAP